MGFAGINGSEFIVLSILALILVGPEKLPEYTRKLANIVKELRRIAEEAKEELREEIGSEAADLDWHKLDLRQYDPRRIIQEAMAEEFGDSPPYHAAAPLPVPLPTSTPIAPRTRQALGEPTPFDTEAT